MTQILSVKSLSPQLRGYYGSGQLSPKKNIFGKNDSNKTERLTINN